MFFNERRARQLKIKQLQDEISAIYDGWRDELETGSSNPASSEAFEPERRLIRLLEQPLRNRADQMGVDILEEWEEVEEHSRTERSYRRLSTSGSAKLHAAIRRKQQERWQGWVQILVPIIGAITGVIGALTALFAMLRK